MPGSRARVLEKAKGLPADGLIFDLEDAVAPDEKAAARTTVAEALAAGGYGARLRLVRVNGLDTEWGAADLDAAATMACDAVLLPKVGAPSELDAAAARLDAAGGEGRALWAMIETPQGVLNAAAIAAHPRLEGFVLGTNDLLKDLGGRATQDRIALMPALAMALLAARAHGVACIGGVYNAFRDLDGLAQECQQDRDMGFDGKTLIHPGQVEVANSAFAPDAAALDEARRQIEAFDEAVASGSGVAVLDGKIVENLHVETARTLIARAEAIAKSAAETA
ncbi:HpcH/HpaI aldolase/citrate lyase family protein [Rhodobacteraceae bacterium KN286]|uniref:HpcH/HpaI aldolase/citrate lyase family protein n=2 Tax=Oceanomicrobium pacificus TaxID=2692916 RepID=A0A6B0TJB0_9RHOB|nr:HpcH/HpaI aldolase/citrate lyase family protein [Oceanomicrobium pacificus]